MKFLKGLIRNLVLLLIIGLVLYALYPDITLQIFRLYGALFGPVAIVILVVGAMPRRR